MESAKTSLPVLEHWGLNPPRLGLSNRQGAVCAVPQARAGTDEVGKESSAMAALEGEEGSSQAGERTGKNGAEADWMQRGQCCRLVKAEAHSAEDINRTDPEPFWGPHALVTLCAMTRDGTGGQGATV